MNSYRLILLVFCIFLTAAAGADELSIKQKILMPGPLIEGHAKYETQCETCHSPFSKSEMTGLCLDCHELIKQDRESGTGFHGQNAGAANAECKTCHTDHEGRQANIGGLMPEIFNHILTRFPLEAAHQGLACDQCHEAGKAMREASSACVDCHREQDVHHGNLGSDCQQCHAPDTWPAAHGFDHSKTTFALQGAHANVACEGCHLAQQYKIKAAACLDCHQKDDIHAGSNGQDCAACHRESDWQSLDFDHNKTRFPLEGLHADQSCKSCHPPGKLVKDTPMTCNGCHKTDDVHLGRNGTGCNNCHNVNGWNKLQFDHNHDTDFPLTGSHKSLGCSQCHAGSLQADLPRECGGCHRGDDVHQDDSMTLCGTCHTTDRWQKVVQFDHDFTQFPLIGLHQLVPCQSCHVGNQFTLGETRCVGCHQDKDVHQGGLGDQCDSCHTPNAWNLWQFDHAAATGFTLDGKHEGLACAACHPAGAKPADASTVCGVCHRRQDIHGGDLGSQCGSCHTTHSFMELMFKKVNADE